MKENGILKNLRETYLLAAADLELFPEAPRNTAGQRSRL